MLYFGIAGLTLWALWCYVAWARQKRRADRLEMDRNLWRDAAMRMGDVIRKEEVS